VQINVVAGQTYYVQFAASAFTAVTIGEYRLSLTHAEASHEFATARPILLAPDGSGRQQGNLSVPGEANIFQFVAPQTTRLTIRQFAPSGRLDSLLSVYGSAQQLLARDDDSGGGLGNSLVSITVVAGQTYYVQAAASPPEGYRSTGYYQLLFVPEDTGNDFATAQLLPLALDGSATQIGAIEAQADVDFFRFVAPQTGKLMLRMEAATGSNLDSALTVYDDAQRRLAQDDNSGGNYHSTLSLNVVAGQTYYVQAEAGAFAHNSFSDNATGRYLLTFSPATDDVADDFAGASLIPLTPDGSGSRTSRLEVAGDTDVFRFVAPRTGRLHIRQEAASVEGLNSLLSVFDANQTLLATDDNGGSGNNSRVDLDVVQGRTYYLRAAASGVPKDYSNPGSFTGRYRLSLVDPSTDEAGDDFATAQLLTLPASGSLTQQRTIGVAGDVDVFQFVAPASGRLHVGLHALPAPSRLSAFLSAFEASAFAARTQFIQSDRANRTHPEPELAFDVTADQTYYIQVEASSLEAEGRNTGPYLLNFTLTAHAHLDDFGNTFSRAHPLTLDRLGFGTQPGTLERRGDVDLFRLVAPRTVQLSVRQVASSGSGSNLLDSLVSVYDAAGTLIARDDNSGGSSNSLVYFNLVRGQSYYIQAGATLQDLFTRRSKTGSYTLTFAPMADDFADDFALAQAIVLEADGSGSQAGTLEVPKDVDFFRFVAPRTGLLTLRQDAVPGSTLNSFLTVYDAAQDLLARNDDSGRSPNSQVQMAVVAGQTYYVRAAAAPNTLFEAAAGASPGSPTGGYRLTFAPGFATEFGTARRITLTPDGSATQVGTIEVAGGVNVFQFVAPFTGPLLIGQEVTVVTSSLNSFLSVFDEGRTLLATDDNSGGAGNSLVRLEVVQGRTYFLQAAASPQAREGAKTGSFTLAIAPARDDFGNLFSTAQPLALSPDGSTRQGGILESPGDVDIFQFVALQTGRFLIGLRATATQALYTDLAVFDASGTPLVRDNKRTGTTISQLQLNLVQGRTYFVQAAQQAYEPGHDVGRYTLTIAPVLDTRGSSPDTATPITLLADGSVSTSGEIGFDEEQDFYQFVAPATGPLIVRMEAVVGSSLDSLVSVFDSQERLLATDDNGAGEFNSLVRLNVVQGQTYYVRASTGIYGLNSFAENTTGRYLLTFAPFLDDVPDTFEQAQPIALNQSGFGAGSGIIQANRDQDVYQFVATVTGKIQIEQRATAGSTRAGQVAVFDDAGHLLARGTPSGLNSVVAFDGVRGQTYFVQAATPASAPAGTNGASESTNGRFVLFFGPPDDVPTVAVPPPLPVPPAPGIPPITLPGIIEVPSDVDRFQFVALVTGQLMVRLETGSDSELEGSLSIFNGSQVEIASSTDEDVLHFGIVAGETYFFEASAEEDSFGDYDLSFGLDFVLPTPDNPDGMQDKPVEPDTKVLPAADSSLAILATLLVDSSRSPANPEDLAGSTALAEAGFLIGLDDPSTVLAGAQGATPTSGTAGAGILLWIAALRPPFQQLIAAVDEIFQAAVATVVGNQTPHGPGETGSILDMLHESAGLVRTALKSLGVTALQPVVVPWQDLASEVFQAGQSTLQVLGSSLHAWFGGELERPLVQPPARAVPGAVPPPEEEPVPLSAEQRPEKEDWQAPPEALLDAAQQDTPARAAGLVPA
ncbi:MAG: PPC domain-containing protein, partial [Gemmataceae bacterium]|nr:PPC domain-containing protein [Gemmataceae bacterium]